MNLDDVGELLGKSVTEAMPKAAVAEAPPAPPPPEQPRAETPKTVYSLPAEELSVPVEAPPLPPPPPAPKGRPAPKPRAPGEDPPLFEQDVDEILGVTAAPEEPERDKPVKVSGMDAMSLSEPVHQIVISPQKATFLLIVVVVLMALSFAAGMLVKG
jgi:hypothetical protein